MKKILYAIALMAVTVVAFSSCKKEEPKIVKRLAMCGDEWDKYVFTYDANGKVTLVNRNEGERTWTFTWADNVATAKYVKEGEEKGNWTFTFGSNGYLSSWANEWGDTFGFTYDATDHLTKIVRVDKNNAAKCNIVWSNGNISKWSRFKDDGSEEWKVQSFLNDDNVAGIFADMTDKTDVPRWVFEVGYVGKPSVKLLDQAAWEGADAIATHTYTKDEDGFVTKVEKFYGGELDQTYEYKWEVVK